MLKGPLLDVTAKDMKGNELFTAQRKYFEIGLDTERNMRYGAWQIKEIYDLTLQPLETETEKFLIRMPNKTKAAELMVDVTYCLYGKECDTIHSFKKMLDY